MDSLSQPFEFCPEVLGLKMWRVVGGCTTASSHPVSLTRASESEVQAFMHVRVGINKSGAVSKPSPLVNHPGPQTQIKPTTNESSRLREPIEECTFAVAHGLTARSADTHPPVRASLASPRLASPRRQSRQSHSQGKAEACGGLPAWAGSM